MRVVLMPRAAAVATLVAAMAVAGCSKPERPNVLGDAEAGRLLLRQFGCGACHRIPGVPTAKGNVGPPLDDIGARAYLAGRLPNTPANMQRWIRDPQSVDPQTAMPNVGLTDEHARDIVAYLDRLR
jgi:cytochrome c1